jgi:exopolysaccharide biosynthesis polyprenyl glycosylphosphotransferase
MALPSCLRLGSLLQATETSPSSSPPTATEAEAGAAGHAPPRTAARLLSKPGLLWTRLALDCTLLALAIAATRVGAPEGVWSDGAFVVWLFPPAVLMLFALRGFYRGGIESRTIDTAGQIISATSLAAIALIAAAALLDPQAGPAAVVARAWLFATVYLIGGRIVLDAVLGRARAAGIVARPTLIVGAGEVGAEMERRLRERPELGLQIVGYIDGDPPPANMVPQRVAPVLGPPSDLVRIAHETGAAHVILAFSSAPDRGLVPLVRQCEANQIEVALVPRMFESLTKRLRFEEVGTLPLVGLRSVDPQGFQFAIKHALDRVVAALLLTLLVPLLAATAIAIRLESPGPVLFRQRRVGRDGRAFDMLKFRSMEEPAGGGEDAAPEPGGDVAPGGVEGADRRTRVGRFLRRHSIDELPQLLNVLKGEMSLVGPRPERPEFAAMFAESLPRYDDRHRVKSGITGWAQVNGLRGRTSLADRVRWDNYYIQNWSLDLDAKILLLTFAAIFRAPGE